MNRIEFKKKHVVVTGGAKGLGLGISKTFASLDAAVTILDLGIDGKKEEELLSVPGIESVKKVDLSDPDAVFSVFDKMGKIDVLINNAGIYPTRSFFEMTPEEWKRMIDIDLNSVFYTTQAAARKMKDNIEGGSIINITTIDYSHPSKDHSHYCAAKAGVRSLTLSTANELGKYHIRVNSIAPGLVDRPGLKESWPSGYERFLSKAPLKKIPTPQDIANVCVFLSSELASSITGAEIPVDSGILSAEPY